MSESIVLEYNGHEITFREDDDEWACYALKLKAKSLTALKRKIDKLDGEARRVSVAALRLDHSRHVKPAQIVMIAKPKDWDSPSFDEQRGGNRDRVPTVWIMEADGNKLERRKVRLDSCFLPSESVTVALKEIDRLRAEIKTLEQAVASTIAAIPRLSIEDLTAKDIREEAIDE